MSRVRFVGTHVDVFVADRDLIERVASNVNAAGECFDHQGDDEALRRLAVANTEPIVVGGRRSVDRGRRKRLGVLVGR